MPEQRSLHRKLAQVMYEAERIPKRGKAPAAMGGFDFVQVGDAADVIRKALAEKAVSMIPTAVEMVGEAEHPTASGKVMTTLTVRTTWTLTDGDSGESIQIQSLGSGADMGDKAAPKAQSNAMKYALLMGFLLSTGDDPELSDSSDRRARRPRADAPTESRAGGPTQAHTATVDFEKPRPVTDAEREGLIGTVEVGTSRDTDFELREQPGGGWAIGFRLVSPAGKIKAIASSPLAEEVKAYQEAIVGKRVTAFGRIRDESFRPTGSQKTVTYQVLELTGLRVPEVGDLPAPTPEQGEAVTAPLFTAEDEAELDAAVPA